MRNLKTIIVILGAGLILSACGRGKATPTPTPTPAPVAPAATSTPQVLPTSTTPAFVSPVSPIPYSRPGIPLDTGRSESALTWLNIARETAATWQEDALFLGIQPSFIMERNLPFLPAQAGWFYRFGREGDALEFYVQVADGEVTGTTEAEAIGARATPTPIDAEALSLDSAEAQEVYLASPGAEGARLTELDYSLEYSADEGAPLWWVWNLEISDTEPVFAINALTGEEVPLK